MKASFKHFQRFLIVSVVFYTNSTRNVFVQLELSPISPKRKFVIVSVNINRPYKYTFLILTQKILLFVAHGNLKGLLEIWQTSESSWRKYKIGSSSNLVAHNQQKWASMFRDAQLNVYIATQEAVRRAVIVGCDTSTHFVCQCNI